MNNSIYSNEEIAEMNYLSSGKVKCNKCNKMYNDVEVVNINFEYGDNYILHLCADCSKQFDKDIRNIGNKKYW